MPWRKSMPQISSQWVYYYKILRMPVTTLMEGQRDERKKREAKCNRNLCNGALGTRAGQVSQSMQTPTFSLHTFQTALHRFQAAPWLLSCHDPATEVCVKVGEGRRRAEERRIPVQKAALHPREAQLEGALLGSHVAHLQPCASALCSVH